MKKITVQIEKITEEHAKKILGLIETVYEQETNVYGGINIIDSHDTTGQVLLIGIITDPSDHPFNVRMLIYETGYICIENFEFEQVIPISIIPVVDFLREENFLQYH